MAPGEGPERRMTDIPSPLESVSPGSDENSRERARIQTAEGEDMEVGVTWRWAPGDKLPDAGLREKYNSER